MCGRVGLWSVDPNMSTHALAIKVIAVVLSCNLVAEDSVPGAANRLLVTV